MFSSEVVTDICFDSIFIFYCQKITVNVVITKRNSQQLYFTLYTLRNKKKPCLYYKFNTIQNLSQMKWNAKWVYESIILYKTELYADINLRSKIIGNNTELVFLKSRKIFICREIPKFLWDSSDSIQTVKRIPYQGCSECFGDLKIWGQLIHTLKYADDLVLMAKEEAILYGRLINY